MSAPSFAKVPQKMIHSGISDTALRLYAHIHWRAGDQGWFTESAPKAGKAIGRSKRTVLRLYDELEQADWIVVVQRQRGNGYGNNKIKPFQSQDACRRFRDQYQPADGEVIRRVTSDTHDTSDTGDTSDKPAETGQGSDTGDTRVVTPVTPPGDTGDTTLSQNGQLESTIALNNYFKPDSINQTQSTRHSPAEPDRPADQKVIHFDAIADQYDPDTKSLPEGYTYIGRYHRSKRATLKTSPWKNPYKIGKDGDRAEVLSKYRDYLMGKPELLVRLGELKGQTLVCWCAPEPCHGDILAELLADADQVIADAQAKLDADAQARQAKADLERDLFDAIGWAWRNEDGGYIAMMRAFLTGKATKGSWGDFRVEPAMSPQEVIAFGKWRRLNNLEMPTVPETIQRTVLAFRGNKLYDRYMSKAEDAKREVLTRLTEKAAAPEEPETDEEGWLSPDDPALQEVMAQLANAADAGSILKG